MDPVLDRVRAANPVSEDEFAGRANFDALELTPRRRRKRWFALPAVGAVVAALVALPTSAPQATEVLEQAVHAVDVDDGILYARSKAQIGPTGGAPTWSGGRQVWVLGEEAMRWKQDDGHEELYRLGEGVTKRGRDGVLTEHPDVTAVPTEVFRAAGLLERARKREDIELEETELNGREAYLVRWEEPSGPPHWPTITMTLWLDRETYAPLRFTDHSKGKDATGKPLDQTYVEDILEFSKLPDTPENRKLLALD